MGWHPGQATLRKEDGVWKQNPQMLMVPNQNSFISLKDSAKIAQFLKEHGLEEDVRPYPIGMKAKYKWKRKAKNKKGGEKRHDGHTQ